MGVTGKRRRPENPAGPMAPSVDQQRAAHQKELARLLYVQGSLWLVS